jgi:site-specific DNA-cytosine methylase
VIKLTLGGSPCTHWSIAQTKNRETEPSGLGWELFKNYLIGLEKYNPTYFLYENNKSMAPAIREQITKELGVEPILINSALVSAQNRQRLYWTNIPSVGHPADKGILLRDVLESGVVWNEKSYCLKAQYYKNGIANFVTNGGFSASAVAEPVNMTADGKAQCLRATCYKDGIRNLVGNTVDRKTCVAEPVRIGTIESDAKNADFDSQQYRVYSPDGKSVTLCGNGGGGGAKTGLYAIPSDGKTYPVYEVRNGIITIKGKQYPIKLADGYYIIRKPTVTECKRLQTVHDSYIFPVSNSQAYKMLGNGWTVDVIAHILSHAPGITTEPVEVLSMYDGMSCGHIALDKLGANVVRYYATEIDKYAIATTAANYPDTVHLGDAFQVREEGWRANHE